MTKRAYDKKLIYSVLAFILPLGIYIYTLAPSISYIDSDELATAASLLRIAHPTGYPLFTILGKVFTMIPIGDEVYRLNLMSAIISSAAIFIFFNLMVFTLKDFRLSKTNNGPAEKYSSEVIYNISFASALLLAFSRTFWDNANVIEVYSLHSFFLVLIIYLFLIANNYYDIPDSRYYRTGSYWLMFAFVLGLSFANHLTTIFLAPAFFYFYFTNYGFNKSSLKYLLSLSIPFIGGLTLYTFLFLRADNTLLSWGHTFNVENFLAHITGRQYNTAMFRSFGDLKIQFLKFTEEFPSEFFYINIILIIPGLIELYRCSKKLFYFTLILFASCVLFAVNYNIFDIYSYFLLALIITALWIGFGLLFVLKRVEKRISSLSYASLLVILIPLILNFSYADKRNDFIVKDYVFNLFNSAPQNSIIISNYTPVYYFQYVKKLRPDIIFINRDFLYNEWYLNSIMTAYPEIYNKSKAEFDNYAIQVHQLQNNKQKYLQPKTQTDVQDIARFQKSLGNLLNSIIENNNKEREVFTTLEIDEVNDEKFGLEYNKIPHGVLLKLTKGNNVTDFEHLDLKYNVTYTTNYFKNYIMNTYYKAYIKEAKYLIENGRLDPALEAVDKATILMPGSEETKQLIQKLNQLKTNNK